MALIKLNLAPDQSGYAVTDGTAVVSTALDGGAARYRKDIANATAAVNVQWSLSPMEFRYLKTFFTLLIDKGANAFLLDLYLDSEELTEHECHFVPGTFKLTGQKGKQFTVGAQLEAEPIKLSDDEESEEIEWATLFGELGEDFETLFPPIEADINQIITFDLPIAFAGPPVEPSGGWLWVMDPQSATTGNLFDVLATVIYNVRWDGVGTWDITEPAGGWLRTFDPTTSTLNDMFDVVATLAHDLPETTEAYTLVAPEVPVYAYDPNTADIGVAMDVLGALLIEMQTGGLIG